MLVIELGSLLVGFVFGWLLIHTAYDAKEWDYKAFLGVLAAIVGGAGVDYLFSTAQITTDFIGYFWIGVFVGFIADIVVRAATKKPYALK